MGWSNCNMAWLWIFNLVFILLGKITFLLALVCAKIKSGSSKVTPVPKIKFPLLV